MKKLTEFNQKIVPYFNANPVFHNKTTYLFPGDITDIPAKLCSLLSAGGAELNGGTTHSEPFKGDFAANGQGEEHFAEEIAREAATKAEQLDDWHLVADEWEDLVDTEVTHSDSKGNGTTTGACL